MSAHVGDDDLARRRACDQGLEANAHQRRDVSASDALRVGYGAVLGGQLQRRDPLAQPGQRLRGTEVGSAARAAS